MYRNPIDLTAAQHAAFRRLAEATDGIDRPAYDAGGRDWRDPIIGLGPADAPLCFMGRDPGAEEVRHGEPFIGAGGRKVRGALHRLLHSPSAQAPAAEPDFDARRAAGRQVFWLNTVPYKPVGNRAWPMAVKKRFQPALYELLFTRWRGRHIITLGREALLWFGLGQPRAAQAALQAFWASEGCFTGSIDILLADPQHAHAAPRGFTLHPLPHPSPLNAVWSQRFPALLDARLQMHAPELRHATQEKT